MLIAVTKYMKEFSKEWLFDQYGGPLFGIISRSVADQNLADDILEKSFQKIFDRLDFNNPHRDHLFSWMLQIARDLINENTLNQTQVLPSRLLSTVVGYQPDLQGSAKDNKILELIYIRGVRSGEFISQFRFSIREIKSCLRRSVQNLKNESIK